MHAAVPGGRDVMRHVADKQGFLRAEAVFGEDIVDFFALVPDTGVSPFQKLVETGDAALHLEMIARGRCSTKSVRIFFARQNSRNSRACGSSTTEVCARLNSA